MLIYAAPLIVWSILRIMQKILKVHPTKTNLILSVLVVMILVQMITEYVIRFILS